MQSSLTINYVSKTFYNKIILLLSFFIFRDNGRHLLCIYHAHELYYWNTTPYKLSSATNYAITRKTCITPRLFINIVRLFNDIFLSFLGCSQCGFVHCFMGCHKAGRQLYFSRGWSLPYYW